MLQNIAVLPERWSDLGRVFLGQHFHSPKATHLKCVAGLKSWEVGLEEGFAQEGR